MLSAALYKCKRRASGVMQAPRLQYGMTTVAETRRANLELLVAELGTLDAVAAAGQTSSIYLSQIRNRALDSDTGRPRDMGPVIARRLEDGTKKPHGWMDEAHPTTALPPSDAPQVRFTLDHALPIVLDALRDAPHRDELRRLLHLLVDTDAPAYRQRLAELLSGQPSKRQANA